MNWFTRKKRDFTVTPTKVLVSAVGAENRLHSMAVSDGAIYSKHYSNVTLAPVDSLDSLIDKIKTDGFDIVHVLLNVNADGAVDQTPAGRILRACADTGVRLIFFASENSPEVYTSHFQSANIDLVMTIDRKEEKFLTFLDSLLQKMTSGKTVPSAWIELAPQTEHASEHEDVPSCIFAVGRGSVVLQR
jgi:hypothetical protein